MNKAVFSFCANHPKMALALLSIALVLGFRAWKFSAVDVFPDVPVPRVTIQSEAGGLTAEEVEQLVTIPIEAAVNGIPGVKCVRSSSSGGLSFVWVDFDWNCDQGRIRFDVFERLSRVKSALPDEVESEITPQVSVTGEIMLVALTSSGEVSALELREMAEFDLRNRLLAVPGIGEVAVMGGSLPEFRIAVNPSRLMELGLSMFDVMEAAVGTRTYLSAGYLPDVAGCEIPIRQLARADSLEAIKRSPVPASGASSLRLSDVADVTVAGEMRRGSSSFNGKNAVVMSVQKTPGGNTPELTRQIGKVLDAFRGEVASRNIAVTSDAYRQADFINASISGCSAVIRDAVVIVVLVLLITLLELRTLLTVLLTMPFSILAGFAIFPILGLSVNVMTLGGFAVAAGDIVDGAIIFTEVIRRKVAENRLLPDGLRKNNAEVIAAAASSVAPGVLFSALIIAVVFLPLMLLSGLEGCFFRPLAFAYLCIFAMSIVVAWTAVPALCRLFRVGLPLFPSRARRDAAASGAVLSRTVSVMQFCYRPFLALALRFPRTVLAMALLATAASVYCTGGFGTSFLPPFREDAFNVSLSMTPGTSLEEAERVAESCVRPILEIPGVLSVTRRTGRAERDQHAEPVSSSEYVVRMDLSKDSEAIRAEIRRRLGSVPGASLLVGYPIAHRISAVLSGTESELAVNLYCEDADRLRDAAAKVKSALDSIDEVSDVRANREITVGTVAVDYDAEALAEAGLTLKEAGEQVSAAFNGFPAGEVRNGLNRRSVTLRLAAENGEWDVESVKKLPISSRNGKWVRLEDIANVYPERAPSLLLREGGRRKALISCNPGPGVDIGTLVATLEEKLAPIAQACGCTLEFGGSYQARKSAVRTLSVLGVALAVGVFILLSMALKSYRAALLVLINMPLGLIGSVVAVALTEPVLSVSSIVGLITVMGFVLRNGLLLVGCYRQYAESGCSREAAIRAGSLERMVPILMTSLTTILGLVPIMVAGSAPGGELLAPLAIVQFGGLVGATVLNLIVLPAAAKLFGFGREASV